jgi:hypothetical protein
MRTTSIPANTTPTAIIQLSTSPTISNAIFVRLYKQVTMIVFFNVPSPSTANMPAQIFDIHLPKRSALFRMQPAALPDSNIEDDAGSKPNNTAQAKLSLELTYGRNAEAYNIKPHNNPTASASMYRCRISGNNGMLEFSSAFWIMEVKGV